MLSHLAGRIHLNAHRVFVPILHYCHKLPSYRRQQKRKADVKPAAKTITVASAILNFFFIIKHSLFFIKKFPSLIIFIIDKKYGKDVSKIF